MLRVPNLIVFFLRKGYKQRADGSTKWIRGGTQLQKQLQLLIHKHLSIVENNGPFSWSSFLN